MSTSNKLGNFLKRARLEAGLSMGQVATVAKTNKGYVARLESGEMSNPSADMLMRLAHALEVKAADLFLVAGIPMPTETPSLEALLRADYDLPDDAIAEARQHIDTIIRRYKQTQADETPKKQAGRDET